MGNVNCEDNVKTTQRYRKDNMKTNGRQHKDSMKTTWRQAEDKRKTRRRKHKYSTKTRGRQHKDNKKTRKGRQLEDKRKTRQAVTWEGLQPLQRVPASPTAPSSSPPAPTNMVVVINQQYLRLPKPLLNSLQCGDQSINNIWDSQKHCHLPTNLLGWKCNQSTISETSKTMVNTVEQLTMWWSINIWDSQN